MSGSAKRSIQNLVRRGDEFGQQYYDFQVHALLTATDRPDVAKVLRTSSTHTKEEAFFIMAAMALPAIDAGKRVKIRDDMLRYRGVKTVSPAATSLFMARWDALSLSRSDYNEWVVYGAND